jgi:hypothetical protein
MRLRIGFSEGLSLARTFIKPKTIITLLKNLGRGRGELRPFLEFMFGKRISYSGVIICEEGVVKHSLYLKVDNGKLAEAGSVKIKNKKPKSAIRELYKLLRERGEVAKVIKYEKGGRLLLHP